jgi:hypothetical protein
MAALAAHRLVGKAFVGDAVDGVAVGTDDVQWIGHWKLLRMVRLFIL